jgi:hypothetical protein
MRLFTVPNGITETSAMPAFSYILQNTHTKNEIIIIKMSCSDLGSYFIYLSISNTILTIKNGRSTETAYRASNVYSVILYNCSKPSSL